MLFGVGAVRQEFRGPPPEGQLEQIIEVMLGTSARIGEVLAIRKCDVDATVSPGTVRICGTIVSPTGKPTYRQLHPKTQKSTRVVSVPSFAAEVIRQRLVVVGREGPDHLLFFTSSKITKEHYIQPDEAVDPVTRSWSRWPRSERRSSRER